MTTPTIYASQFLGVSYTTVPLSCSTPLTLPTPHSSLLRSWYCYWRLVLVDALGFTLQRQGKSDGILNCCKHLKFATIRCKYLKLATMYNIVCNNYFFVLLSLLGTFLHILVVRMSVLFVLPFAHVQYLFSSFVSSAIRTWNSLLSLTIQSPTVSSIKISLKCLFL